MPRRTPKYVMKISRLTVDKLGVKLYDRVSAVIAELVSNAYDADAKLVTISAPMGVFLAQKKGVAVEDLGHEIRVTDDGIGMTSEEVNRYYLRVGAERRKDERGDTSRVFGRKVMGAKGVGKLAPFGICSVIEVITSGGDRKPGTVNGKTVKGFETSHIILERNAILEDKEIDYAPKIGKFDGTISKDSGTTVILRDFTFRRVPLMEEFGRQLAQRFGLPSQNWKIELVNSIPAGNGEAAESCTVGSFSVQKMENTQISFEPTKKNEIKNRTFDADGNVIPGIEAGFAYEGTIYPIRGWVAYAKEPYKDDLMAGIRIYCRGKIAAQTTVFNRKAGFTGEHDVRSYLVGEIHADWLDSPEDLIQTDRRDILWSHELGRELETWGQNVIKHIGVRSRDPMKKKTWELFRQIAKLDERVKDAFPGKEQKDLRDNALDVAKLIGQTIRPGELQDPERVENFVQLSLMLAPVITLDAKLREAADNTDSPLQAVTEVLKTARVAELASFGRIAEDRVRVIERVETLKDSADTLESAFQTLITTSPWLIDPQWSPITANQAFTTLRDEFQKFYKNKTGEELVLQAFSDGTKRADFVMSNQDNAIQIIEIKKPAHKLTDEEFGRIMKYRDLMAEFLDTKGHEEFKTLFPRFHITLVCDGLKLTSVYKQAFDSLTKDGVLTYITWKTFLLRTRKMHESFLQEAQRQKDIAVKQNAVVATGGGS